VKTLVIGSLKGGVGKSTICAGLGLALLKLGYRIGFLDVDVHGANLPTALGIDSLKIELDTKREKLIPSKMNGYEILSLASHFGKGAVLWKDNAEEILGEILKGTGKYDLVAQMIKLTDFSDLDFLLVDLPPSSGGEVLSLYENLNVFAQILVCQPTDLACEDLERMVNLLEVKKIPLLGLVINMASCICPRCGEVFFPFLDPAKGLEEFCKLKNIPILATIPFSQRRKDLEDKFIKLAIKVVAHEPQILELSFKQKLEKATFKVAVKHILEKL